MIRIEERNDVVPICPHCSTRLDGLWFRELRGILGRRYVYFCPTCAKVLGISHRKGLFMG